MTMSENETKLSPMMFMEEIYTMKIMIQRAGNTRRVQTRRKTTEQPTGAQTMAMVENQNETESQESQKRNFSYYNEYVTCRQQHQGGKAHNNMGLEGTQPSRQTHSINDHKAPC